MCCLAGKGPQLPELCWARVQVRIDLRQAAVMEMKSTGPLSAFAEDEEEE